MSPRASCADAPALEAIVADSLRHDLAFLASDTMRGREAGTVDELRAAAWIARRARDAGLQPAGEDGSWFQFFPIRRTRLTPGSTVTVGDSTVSLWRDGVLMRPAEARIDASIVFVGRGREADLAGRDIRGQVVAAVLTPPERAPGLGPMLSPRRYATLAVRERAAFLARRGARAVLLVSDSVADEQYDNIAAGWARGDWALATQPEDSVRVPVLWLRRRELPLVASGARLVARLDVERFVVPSVNVIATVPGRDAALRNRYVLLSAHTDALGVRFPWPVTRDSVWHGADDNASTSVALLAIGRAFVAHPDARSILFVWHGAEEPGLLGSSWYVAHPTVPKSSIVAVLNGDMIGRNAPDTAALLGSQPPNRTSAPLVNAALRANAIVSHFVIDSSWDRAGHPENFFHRSDHWPYARTGLPAIYFSTLLHEDYHTPADLASRIDYGKLTRMARWMYATAWAVGCAGLE